MKLLAAALLFAASLPLSASSAPPNTLTPAEAHAGWILLWDGRTAAGWRGLHGPFPTLGWRIHDGILTVAKSGLHPGLGGGDIITDGVYRNFELSVDFRLTSGANSGIKYFVDPAATQGNGVGFEYQLLDDDSLATDPVLANLPKHSLGALYDILPPAADKPMRPIGVWNTARIVVRGAHGEHWLNGRKILEYTRFTPGFDAALRQSKFTHFPGVADRVAGHILLQEHDGEASFRNLKLRVLPAP